jgi:hypothetical protein
MEAVERLVVAVYLEGLKRRQKRLNHVESSRLVYRLADT